MFNPFQKKYWVSPTSEYWGDIKSEYINWWVGRVEVYDDDEVYDIDEYRYLFPPEKIVEFQQFIEQWESTNLNWFQLQYIKLIIKLKFYVSK